MKPKSIRAAIQMMLPEVEEMLSVGVAREEVFKAVSDRFHLENMNVRSFDTALYRARQNRAKHASTDSVLHNKKDATEEDKKKQSPGIIGKEFFDEAKTEFDPDKFIKKY